MLALAVLGLPFARGAQAQQATTLVARTAANVPAPNHSILAAAFFEPGTATSPEDYRSGFLLLSLGASGWSADGDAYVTSSRVPLSIVDDSDSEDTETLSVALGAPPDLPGTVDFVAADGTSCTDSCKAAATITDDDEALLHDEQEVHSGTVSIAAEHPTALQGIDDLVFTVTRAVDVDSDLEVPVTLSSGIIDANRLSYTVTIPANKTSAELRVHTRTLDPAAATGDVTATVDDGEQQNVPDPPAASVRVYAGETLVTVRLNAGAYTLEESVGPTTDEISVIAETAAGVPAPNSNFGVTVSTDHGTAVTPRDFLPLSEEVLVPGASDGTWTGDGTRFASEVAVPLTIIDDDEAEGDETLTLKLEFSPVQAATIGFVPADETAPPCSGRTCESTVTIVDDDNRGVTLDRARLTVDEGDAAVYTVVLDSKPTGDVTITPRCRAPGTPISQCRVL